jgi:hypothetical protein
MTEAAEYRRGSDGRDGYVTGGALDDVPLTVEESLDSDDLGDTDAGLDPLDDSWDAPDRPSFETRLRPTATESLAGGSLAEHLAQEIPDVDPYAEAERAESGRVLEDDVVLAGERPGGPPGGPGNPGYLAGGDEQAAEDEAARNDGKNEIARNAPGNVTGFEGTAGNDERDRRPVTLVAADSAADEGLTARAVDDRADHGCWPLAPEESALHLVV